jgi:hypothetical protein
MRIAANRMNAAMRIPITAYYRSSRRRLCFITDCYRIERTPVWLPLHSICKKFAVDMPNTVYCPTTPGIATGFVNIELNDFAGKSRGHWHACRPSGIGATYPAE